ncbi:sigma-54 interaction domain-containing protein [Maledivibacter halophilus]|uniref:Transcriptional regulator containing PAS, AAA-type ATPase, and DNA-binding Fis domains n=1 Tax=Maledivibacter halophilus TaxID=36842 RepID=A0A1T5LJM0_9FIRM|nr:sigma 54-interacting transcriptional regulator [Maledivibacter halophilus]SKC76181.1 Transcriptional regulator containing PAS, AAA-type ATPase, and DNA-binding Fis domains [Maledivibacter halophilus]
MDRNKKIIIISLDYVANRALTEQLNEVFGEKVEVISILLNEHEKINVEDIDLIVCSSKIIVEKIKKKINKLIPIIPVRRTVNLKKITEVISLNAGEKVLLVNNHLYTANETINLLKKLGVDHIEFVPYFPGCKEEIQDIAVTPGGSHLVPKGVKRIIDIGIRIIDISSIIEIFLELSLPIENFQIISESYSKEMVRLNRFNSETNKILKAMFEITHDGIAALDVSGNIFFSNKKFADFLQCQQSDLISKNIVEIINDKEIIDIIIDSKQRNNEIIDIDNKQFMLNKTFLYQGNLLKGHVVSLQDVTHIQNLEKEVRKKLATKGFVAKYNFDDLIGISSSLLDKIKIAKKIAKNDLTVLIQGEDGTGKEIFAQAIHNSSMRKNGPFVAVNFAAISENLMESELFGYEEGAFTGATKGGKEGVFEQADKGTIFIDEIGDISPQIQKRLLRVLQEKEVMRVGGSKIIPVDVRVIAATNKDLMELVKEKKFRKDLYYRLKVLYFTIPLLKERKEDIPLLAKYYLKSMESDKKLSNDVLDILTKYSWPGNVRELVNLMYYLDSIVDNQYVVANDLPENFIQEVYEGENIKTKDNCIFGTIDTDLLPANRINEYIKILKVLKDANDLGIIIGRNKISRILKKNQFYLSSEQVRGRIKDMEKAGLIEIGNTKQGSTISKKGKMFLKEYIGEYTER